MKAALVASLSVVWRSRFNLRTSANASAFLLILGMMAAPDIFANTNVAQGKPARQTSTVLGGDASRAVDGNKNGKWEGNSVTHTGNGPLEYWEVDLQGVANIEEIRIFPRQDGGDAVKNRILGARIQVLQDTKVVLDQPFSFGYGIDHMHIYGLNVSGNKVRVVAAKNQYLSLAEVTVGGEMQITDDQRFIPILPDGVSSSSVTAAGAMIQYPMETAYVTAQGETYLLAKTRTSLQVEKIAVKIYAPLQKTKIVKGFNLRILNGGTVIREIKNYRTQNADSNTRIDINWLDREFTVSPRVQMTDIQIMIGQQTDGGKREIEIPVIGEIRVWGINAN